ncbi:MAG: tRNA 5-methoxyuridine(34)/uridine 5-oxyacetic acid(34) synthase CmoB [Xanthomonadales bacterium]|jgi:tRNA (mo5U34)-methyltransferase|nr:tRNA 5-methoxyuridine(34)/uridine 5-oxyacetic acid(34) synthase CmoB [Xanthomonadales bacterium]
MVPGLDPRRCEPAFDAARQALMDAPVHIEPILARASAALACLKNGDLPRWLAALDALPATAHRTELGRAAPRLGAPVDDPEGLIAELQAFHPWRKGPLNLGGVVIDTEWRSDWKWARLAGQVDFRNCSVLDVGCGNGYFGWRMLGAGARCVVGIDPTVLFVVQWLVQQHFSGPAPNLVLPLRDTDLPQQSPGPADGIPEENHTGFDRVCSMGVLYHRRDPEDHLQRLAGAGRPGGLLLLETLVLEGDGHDALRPEGRYARMRNVHEVPTIPHLLDQVTRAGFHNARVLDCTRTTPREQRSTAWMRFESLDRCLDPGDPTRTVEGHPAPVRALLVAEYPPIG